MLQESFSDRTEDAKLNRGEILVAPYTDPGWTPLFTSVVGIEKAKEIIKDGAYIRVDGTNGFVQILEGSSSK